MRIVFLDASTIGEVSNLTKLKSLGDFISYPMTLREERAERLKNADILITNKVIIDREIMDACPDLKLICIAATGMNNVDLDYAQQKGITVKNVKGYSTESVVQSVFSMLFYVLHHSRYYDEYVKTGKYSLSPIFTHHLKTFNELKGKRFGIIGLGAIGKRVASVASAFGCDIIYYSTTGKNNDNDYKSVVLESLLRSSDIISIHCPLNSTTFNLINYSRIKLMKTSAILLNAGRGGIINETDLAKALDEDLIAGAALDVLEKEPIVSDNPLLQIRNKEKLFITPHMAWTSIESRESLIESIYNNIHKFINHLNS